MYMASLSFFNSGYNLKARNIVENKLSSKKDIEPFDQHRMPSNVSILKPWSLSRGDSLEKYRRPVTESTIFETLIPFLGSRTIRKKVVLPQNALLLPVTKRFQFLSEKGGVYTHRESSKYRDNAVKVAQIEVSTGHTLLS